MFGYVGSCSVWPQFGEQLLSLNSVNGLVKKMCTSYRDDGHIWRCPCHSNDQDLAAVELMYLGQ